MMNPNSKKKNTPNPDANRMALLIEILEQEYPTAGIQLDYKNPLQLLVATMLSAQCTDERVNKVTAVLFKKYFSPEDYLKVPIEILEQDIFSTGFYKAKAAHIRSSAQMIIENFQGEVPNNMEDLLKLPGVGRKSANVVLGHCFGKPGIVVDTHVSRIAMRLGFVETRDAVKAEFRLMELVPKEKWVIFTHYLIEHGRKICQSRKPKCHECKLEQLCPKNL